MDRKNIILITIDCLRSDHINNMEKLLQRNRKIVFTRMFANATYTGLSVPSMLTSTIPPLEKPELNVAHYLKEAGYSTAAFVPNALLLDNRYRRFRIEKGFDAYKNYLREDLSGMTLRAIDKLMTGIRDSISSIAPMLPRGFLRSLQKAAGFVPLTVWIPYPRAERVLDEARKKIVEMEKPYFLWIHLMDVHGPYLPPDNFRTGTRNDMIIANKRLRYSKTWLPPEDVKTLHQLYCDNIRYVDNEIDGLLHDVMDDNTIVIVTADHGEQFLEHNGIGHTNWSMYDEQLHIPLVLLNTGATNATNDKLVSLIDIAPTITALSDISAEEFWGRNIFLEDKEQPVFFAGYDRKWNVLTGIRTTGWKLFRGVKGWELYDLKKDPKEKKNMYKEKPDKATALKYQLVSILEMKNQKSSEEKRLRNIAKKVSQKQIE